MALNNKLMKRALIIGASSGIGHALAIVLAHNGYKLGLVSRRIELLNDLNMQLNNQALIKQIDITSNDLIRLTTELISELGGVDLVILNAGTGFINTNLDWQLEKKTIDVNINGIATLSNIAMQYFIKQKSGHLVTISSIAAIRGSRFAPAYSASKAFISNYADGLTKMVKHLNLPITITDIQPGFVDTEMAKSEQKFWVATPEKAAQQIFQAIVKKKRLAYITKRWRLIAWLLKIMPNFIHDRIG